MRRKDWPVVLVAVVTIVLVACGGGAPSSTPPSSGQSSAPASPAQKGSAAPSSSAAPASQAPYSPFTYAGADRLQKLEAEAKKEGKLTFYTSLAGDAMGLLAEGFKQDYGIEVSAFRAGDPEMITRMAQENQANRNVVDVVEVSMGGILDLRELGLLQPYYSPTAKALPKDRIMPATGDQVWGANDRVSYIAFAYNKNLVPAGWAPKTFEDLLHPDLKGKLTIGSSGSDVSFVGLVLEALGDAKGREFLAKLSAQNVGVETITAASVMELIGAGQKTAQPTIFRNHFQQQLDKGAPVAWVALDNVATAWVGMVATANKAPHPNAAVLFAEYLLSGNGVKILERTRYDNLSVQPPFKPWIQWTGLTAKEHQQRVEMRTELFEKTFRK